MPIFNPSTGGGGGTTISQVSTDPVSPAAEDAWVLKTTAGAITDGVPIGLMLALTYQGNTGSSTYQFSFRTLESTTIRVSMTSV